MAEINSGYFDQLGRSPRVVALVNQRRDAVAAAARASAKVDSAAYRRGIVTGGKIQNRRYVGLVIGTDPKTLLLESLYGTLARALRSVSRG